MTALLEDKASLCFFFFHSAATFFSKVAWQINSSRKYQSVKLWNHHPSIYFCEKLVMMDDLDELYKTSLYEEVCMTSSLFRTNTKTFWLICQVCVSLWSPRWVFVSNSLLIFLTMIEIGFVSFLYGYEFLKPRRWQRQILLSSFSASVQNIQHNWKLHILWRTDNPPVLLMVVCWKINQSSIRSMFI